MSRFRPFAVFEPIERLRFPVDIGFELSGNHHQEIVVAETGGMFEHVERNDLFRRGETGLFGEFAQDSILRGFAGIDRTAPSAPGIGLLAMFGSMRDQDAARFVRLDQAAGCGAAPEARFAQRLHVCVAIRHDIDAIYEAIP